MVSLTSRTSARGTKNKIVDRGDMVGISEHTNVHATLAFSKSSKKITGIDSGTDLLNIDAEGKLILPIWKAC